VAWHPNSPTHFGVLKSDNTFSIFSIRSLAVPEQTFRLRAASASFALSALAESASLHAQRAADFAFSAGPGWDGFAIYFMFQDGSLYALCPVAPFGMSVRMMLVHHLMSIARGGEGGAGNATAVEWMQAVTGLVDLGGGDSGGGWREHERNEFLAIAVHPHSLAGCCPVLQARKGHARGCVSLKGARQPSPSALLATRALSPPRLQHLTLIVALLQGPLAEGDAGPCARFSQLLLATAEAPGGGSVTVVTTVGCSATAGRAVTHLALDDVAPQWQRGAVRALTTPDGATVTATSLEPMPSTVPPSCEFAARDSVQLPIREQQPEEAEEEEEGAARVWAAACGPHRAIVRLAGQLWDLQLPWVRDLAGALADGADAGAVDLCPVVVNPLAVWRRGGEPLGTVAACALLQHVLTDDALVAVDAVGRCALLSLRVEPPGCEEEDDADAATPASTPQRSPTPQPASPSPHSDVQLAMEQAVSCAYQRVRSAPARPADLTRDAAAARSTEAAIKALNGSIEALSQRFMTHLYASYADLHERFKAVAATLQAVGDGGSASAEAAHAAETQGALAEVQANSEGLERRLNVCKQVQSVLGQRAALLSTILLLNVNAPGGVNAAETEFEAEVAQVREELVDMRKHMRMLAESPTGMAAPQLRGARAGRSAQELVARSNVELQDLAELEAATREGLRRLQGMA